MREARRCPTRPRPRRGRRRRARARARRGCSPSRRRRGRAGPASSGTATAGGVTVRSTRTVNQNVLPRRARCRRRSSRPSARRGASRWRARARCLRGGAAPGPRSARTPGRAAAARPRRCRCPCRAPRSGAAATRRWPPHRGANHHLAAVGELERVADEVDEHLAQPAGSPRTGTAGGGVDVGDQLEALGVRLLGATARPPLRARCRGSSVGWSADGPPPSSSGRGRRRRSRAAPRRSGARCANTAAARVSWVSSRRPALPMMAFIGLRISWPMVARQLVLRRCTACSAASLASRSSKLEPLPLGRVDPVPDDLDGVAVRVAHQRQAVVDPAIAAVRAAETVLVHVPAALEEAREVGEDALAVVRM